MVPSYPIHPDLGEHAWHEERGFFHGYINGIYYRMVCSSQELEEVREQESSQKQTPPTIDDLWQALDLQKYVNPCDESYGPFESASPFEEDMDVEARRRIIAVNMCLDPTTTTWYGLGKHFDVLMSIPRQKDRQQVLTHRLIAFGLDPRKEQQPETRHLRALAFELGLNPYRATWEEIDRCDLQLHKVILPRALAQRANDHLSGQSENIADLLQKALTAYLDQQEQRESTVDEEELPRTRRQWRCHHV